MNSPDFSADWFARYIAERRGRTVEVDRFEKFARGTSRQTWFVDYREDGCEHAAVLRTDHPAGSGDPTSLAQECAIYRRLGGSGLPVARVLFAEKDAAGIPRAFYMRERVVGSWRVPGIADMGDAGGRVRLAAAQEHIRALAAVHDLDWRDAGLGDCLPVPQSEVDAAPCYVRTQLERYQAFGGAPSALLWEVAELLRDTAPPAGRLSLCKGTNGLGEEVFRDGRIVAMSDWEEAIIGDPASDLAMVQGFAEPIEIGGERVWDLEAAVAFYNTVGATPVAIENVRFYQLARLFGRMVMFAYTTTVVERSGAATVRQSWTAIEVQHAMRRVLAAALGWLPPVEASLFEELNATIEDAA